MGYQGQQDSSWNNSTYAGGVSSPAATYQPGGNRGDGKIGTATGGQNDHEHGYEWEQAREAERLERMQQQGSGPAPPGYDVSVGNSECAHGRGRLSRVGRVGSELTVAENVVTGNTSGNDTFAPPPGPPPGK
jgi:hypothetical protein